MGKFKDLTGQRFNMLLVLESAGRKINILTGNVCVIAGISHMFSDAILYAGTQKVVAVYRITIEKT